MKDEFVTRHDFSEHKAYRRSINALRPAVGGMGDKTLGEFVTSLRWRLVMAQAQSKVTDPVCGMSVDPLTASARSEYQGSAYYFCSKGCKTRFDADPASYAGAAGSGSGRG